MHSQATGRTAAGLEPSSHVVAAFQDKRTEKRDLLIQGFCSLLGHL